MYLVIIEHCIHYRALQDTELVFVAVRCLISTVFRTHLQFCEHVLFIWEHVMRKWYPVPAFQTLLIWGGALSERHFPHFGRLDRDHHLKLPCQFIPSTCEFTSCKTVVMVSVQESCSESSYYSESSRSCNTLPSLPLINFWVSWMISQFSLLCSAPR